MPLDFSNITYTATITVADYTEKTTLVRYNLTANTLNQCLVDAQTIAHKLKSISTHRITTVKVNTTYTNLDTDTPTQTIEKVAYFAGETVTGRWAVVEVPGYIGPLVYENNIDLANTLVNDLLILYLNGGIVYPYDSQSMSEFCRGWVLTRGKQPR